MSKINLVIANASKYFSCDEVSIIQKATAAAEEYIAGVFNFDYNLDLIVAQPSYIMSTIAEDGISGRTYLSGFLMLVLDKEQAEIHEDFIFETICHEMSHSLRWEKLDEHSRTVFDGMILEGLAIALELKAMDDTKRTTRQFFLNEMISTDQVMIDSMISQLKHVFESDDYDYDRIFFTGDGTLPRWAGYRLGYYFVRRHLEATGMSIEDATLASYSDFTYSLQ